MSKFSEVLKNRNFFLLWLGQIISQVGDRLGQMALIALVSVRPGNSTIAIAKVLFFTIAPVFIIGPLAGVYVDRWDRRRTLYISDTLRAMLMLAIPLFLFNFTVLIPLYAVIFLVFCIGRFFIPAKLSILPELVENKDMLIANSLINITGMIAAILGFGISGILVEWWGAKGGFYLDAASFFVSALLIFLIAKKSTRQMDLRKVSQEIVEVISKSVVQEIKEGLLYFFKNKEIRFASWVMFILSAALGSCSVVLIGFIQDAFHSVTRDFGLLSMFLGLGLFLGSLVYGRFGQRFSSYKIIFVSLVISGKILFVFVLNVQYNPSFLIAVALSLIMGVFISPIIIAVNTTIHSSSANHMMGKIFSSLEVVMHLGFILFMFASGLLAKIVPHSTILMSCSFIFIILGLVNLIFHRRIPWLD